MLADSGDGPWLFRFCRRRIFAERFGYTVLAPLSRRTGRLETIIHHLERALGARPAAAIAERLTMPVSNDTLLRVVRRPTEQPRDKFAIIGIDDFQTMIRSKPAEKLDNWLMDAKTSLVRSFANGVEKDIAAVRNAIMSPWSNGQTECQITGLKLIKRQMHGRAKIDPLQARLIGAA